MDPRFGVTSHYLDGGYSPFNPSATPPRRLRKSGLVEPKFGSVVNLNTDDRVRYFYDMDDGVSEAIWVASGRASGWQDTSQNSYHLNKYYRNSSYVKPWFYSDPGPGILNGEPGLYFDGNMPTVQACCLWRDEQDVFVYNTGSGGKPMQGFLFMMVFHMADQYYNEEVSAISTYPRIKPLEGDSESNAYTAIHLGNMHLNYTSGSFNWPEGIGRGYIRTPKGERPSLDETHVITLWGDMQYHPGMASYRLDGKTRQYSFIQCSTYQNVSFYEDWPGHYKENCLFGACHRVNWYRSTQKWYMGCAFLAYGDFTFGEIDYLETKWMNKYDIARAV